MSTTIVVRRSAILALAVAVACSTAAAQSPPKQVVKPPVAEAWIDVATFSGFPMGGMGPGGGGMMNATLGSLMGGGKGAVDQAAWARLAAHYARVLRSADALYRQGGEGVRRGLALFDQDWPHIQVGQAWAAAVCLSCWATPPLTGTNSSSIPQNAAAPWASRAAMPLGPER